MMIKKFTIIVVACLILRFLQEFAKFLEHIDPLSVAADEKYFKSFLQDSFLQFVPYCNIHSQGSTASLFAASCAKM